MFSAVLRQPFKSKTNVRVTYKKDAYKRETYKKEPWKGPVVPSKDLIGTVN